MSPRRLFRILSFAEAVTWTLLIAGMLLKYVARVGDWPVSIAGPIHGFVFIAYGIASLVLAVNQRWSVGSTLLAVGSAVVPYATIPVELAFDRRGKLAGPWRRTETDDPRDRRVVDRALRWALTRPLLATGVLVAAAALIFVALLIVGPPGGSEA